MRPAVRLWLRDSMLNTWLASPLVPHPARAPLLKLAGLNIGRAKIMPHCFFGGTDITIGDNTFVNYGAFFDNLAQIKIGDHCALGPRVTILTGTHHLSDERQRAGLPLGLPTTIGNGCWIGAGVTILPGVRIGHGTVVGAGALVTRDCQPNGVYMGTPARLVRPL